MTAVRGSGPRDVDAADDLLLLVSLGVDAGFADVTGAAGVLLLLTLTRKVLTVKDFSLTCTKSSAA